MSTTISVSGSGNNSKFILTSPSALITSQEVTTAPFTPILSDKLLKDLNNLMSKYPDYIPFDSVSENITMPQYLVKNGWIVQQKGTDPTLKDLTFYTENGNGILFENSTGKWDTTYYKNTNLQVVSLKNTSKGINLLSVGNKEWYINHATEVMAYVGNIVVTETDAWISVEIHDTTKKEFYYYSIGLNIKYTGGSINNLKNDVEMLGGSMVELNGKISVVFPSNIGHPYTLPLPAPPLAGFTDLEIINSKNNAIEALLTSWFGLDMDVSSAYTPIDSSNTKLPTPILSDISNIGGVYGITYNNGDTMNIDICSNGTVKYNFNIQSMGIVGSETFNIFQYYYKDLSHGLPIDNSAVYLLADFADMSGPAFPTYPYYYYDVSSEFKLIHMIKIENHKIDVLKMYYGFKVEPGVTNKYIYDTTVAGINFDLLGEPYEAYGGLINPGASDNLQLCKHIGLPVNNVVGINMRVGNVLSPYPVDGPWVNAANVSFLNNIPDNLNLAIFTKPEHIYYNSGEKNMQASKLFEWMKGSEPHTWNTTYNYDGSTNQWPIELINQAWWCGVGFGSFNATNLTMSLGYYYLDGSKNMAKYAAAPSAEYSETDYDYVTTVKGELQIASDGSVSVKDVSNILSVISSGVYDGYGRLVFAEVFDTSTSVPTAITCYCGFIVGDEDVPCSCQCTYVKTISQDLINYINTQIGANDISLNTHYP